MTKLGRKMKVKKGDKKKRKINVRRRNHGGNSFSKKMNKQLLGAQFRFLNERLYTSKSSDAVGHFRDKDIFKMYHEGFNSQISKWPLNPEDCILGWILNLKGKTPLIIGDLGCGEGKLSEKYKINAEKLHKNVRHQFISFDLIGTNRDIIQCDIAKAPLRSGLLDVAVFCLSLMATNFIEFLIEANRILKKEGFLMVAEVKSRFVDYEKFLKLCKSLGFNLVQEEKENKMFTMAKFRKNRDYFPKGKIGFDGAEILRPCVYKRR